MELFIKNIYIICIKITEEVYQLYKKPGVVNKIEQHLDGLDTF